MDKLLACFLDLALLLDLLHETDFDFDSGFSEEKERCIYLSWDAPLP